MPDEARSMDAVTSIANEEARRHMDSIDDAVAAAYRRVKRLADYEEFVETLVLQALRERIHNCRHGDNVSTKRQEFGTPAKVVPGRAVADVCARRVYLDYLIDGRRLGGIRGNELPGLADSYTAKAAGCEFVGRLCRELTRHVAADKLVSQCMTDAQVGRLFDRLQRRERAAAAC